MADREFVGEDWLEYLNRECISYHLRIRKNFRVRDHVPEIIISFNKPEEAISSYKERWQIETAFKAMKTSGFNIEDTHLTNINRIERLFAIMTIAFTWAYLVGINKDANFNPLELSNTEKELKVSSSMDWKKLKRHFQTHSKKRNSLSLKFLSCT